MFGFQIAFYGVIIGLGIFCGILLAAHIAKKEQLNPDLIWDFAIYAIVFSIIGARIYYVIFEWDSYKNDLLQIFNLRAGGMAIYGGIIAAVITLIVFAKKKKLSIGLMLDTGGLGLILGQIIGRWGNFVNREAFGGYTDGLLAMQLKMSEVYSAYITDDIAQHIQTINGVDYIQVHPTFLYESLWNIGVLIFLILFKKHKKFNGEVFCFYLILYGIGRSWIEGLRTDQLKVGDIAVSQVLSILLVLGVSIFVIWKHMKLRKEKWNELLKEKES